MFLTDAEREELTGYVQYAAQIRWLKRNGVKFYLQGITGRPMVLKESLAVKSRSAEEEGPRLDWVRRRERKKAA